ncbi:uncharacterized protein PHACADRAFT_97653, partial [Phanerochaete carnosa HHB-10118-sp]
QMQKYKSQMASTTTLSSVSEFETQQQKAHNFLFKTKAKTSAAQTVEQEWISYIAEPTYPSVDVLVYWQASKARFPTIYNIAIDILPIQSSAVSCKHVFSFGKMTATDRHNRMGRDLVEKLQMLKFQFKQATLYLSHRDWAWMKRSLTWKALERRRYTHI